MSTYQYMLTLAMSTYISICCDFSHLFTESSLTANTQVINRQPYANLSLGILLLNYHLLPTHQAATICKLDPGYSFVKLSNIPQSEFVFRVASLDKHNVFSIQPRRHGR